MTKAFVSKLVSGFLCAGLAIGLVFAQSSKPTADQPYAGDRNVTGSAPGATSLTVYAIVSNVKRYLGSGGSIDKNGSFAVAVNPPLKLGQNIVVIDSLGRSSAVVQVVAKTGPAARPE